MAMDEQQRAAYRWGLVAKSGYCGHRLTPRADEPVWVDEVSLVGQADDGQCAVDARVEIGTRDLLLATLSAEKPEVVLQTPVLLDEEFCFYVTPHGGYSDSDSGADADTESDDTNDGVAVYFGGIMCPLEPLDMEEDEEAGSSEYSDDGEEKHEKESEATGTEDDGDAVSSGNKDFASCYEEEKRSDSEVGRRSGIFAFLCLLTFLVLVMSLMYC
jgi:hypothetical protein